jgi:hypothetical protein
MFRLVQKKREVSAYRLGLINKNADKEEGALGCVVEDRLERSIAE